MTIKIDISNGEVLISLNRKFYDLKLIKSVLLDFLDVCVVGLDDENQEYVSITLIPKDSSLLEIIGYEFCNYLLVSKINRSQHLI